MLYSSEYLTLGCILQKLEIQDGKGLDTHKNKKEIKTLFNRLYLGKKLYVIPTAGSCHPKLTASTWQMISIEK